MCMYFKVQLSLHPLAKTKQKKKLIYKYATVIMLYSYSV